jgi:hypothetical protein
MFAHHTSNNVNQRGTEIKGQLMLPIVHSISEIAEAINKKFGDKAKV